MKFVTLGTSEHSITIIGQDGSVDMSKDSATRLRNHLCLALGVPTQEELDKPNGDPVRFVMEVGGVLYENGQLFDGRTGDLKN